MSSLTREQVLTWRLSRHFLLDRAPRSDLLTVVRRLGGMQAQVMSAAEMQLAARVDDLRPDDVREALWKQKTLLKTWQFRGTLHLFAADELPLYAAALHKAIGPFYRSNSWLKARGMTLEEYDAIIEGVRAALSAEPMTREQLAAAVMEKMNAPHLGDLMLSGWGSLLKPSAHVGALCFAPSQGQNVTFVSPEKWLGSPLVGLDEDEALREVAQRYLDTYGPATPGSFGGWLGMNESRSRRLFRELGDDITEVEVDGWKAWALTRSADALAQTEPRESVRMVPNFDPYVLGTARHSELLIDAEHKPRVWRQAGWISPCVLVNGRVAGVWSLKKGKGGATIEVDLFAPVSRTVVRGIEAETERMMTFLNSGTLADDE